MSLYAQYAALLDGVLDDLVADGALPAELDRRNVTVEPPRDAAHGDLATNAAMVLAKPAWTNPRSLAELIKAKLEALPPVTSVEIAGPGFINLRLKPDAWRDELRTILNEGDCYGISTIGNIFGTLFTTFYLIPTIGSREITYVYAAVLALCALSLLLVPKGPR